MGQEVVSEKRLISQAKQLPLFLALPEFTSLDEFCWGENQYLEYALKQSLEGKGERFFYLWGRPGSGKSHLLQGCCLAAPSPEKALYLPLALLKDYGPESVQDIVPESYDLITLDDIDSIAGLPAWEEVIFNWFRRLKDQGSTLCMVSGQVAPVHSPLKLADLRSRLNLGLVIQLHELSDESKLLTLQHYALQCGLVLSEKVGVYLLTHYSRNMHALREFLKKLDKASLAEQRKLSIPFVKEVANQKS
ncbi:MAG: DnaA regulatory inactivator Hda [Legionellaceae bacterium]|nr:DnaA regulatory inactivator Hda [Legionellaceae bacterium]